MGLYQENKRKINSNFSKQSLALHGGSPWYIRNDNLHKDLKMEYVNDEIKNHAKKHIQRLSQHKNADLRRMLINPNPVRRLRRTKPLELGQLN